MLPVRRHSAGNKSNSNGLDYADGKLKGGSNYRKAADVAQQADIAILLAAAAAAEVETSKTADGKVVADRIGGIELREPVGDRPRRLPVGRFAVVQPQKSRDAMHVRVERHDQLRGINKIPDAEIRRGAADHPAKEEIHAFARAAAA